MSRLELYGIQDRTICLPLGATAIDLSSMDYVNTNGFIVRVGGAGTVRYRPYRSDTDITETWAAGEIIPVALKTVYFTGTTATDLVAYWWPV